MFYNKVACEGSNLRLKCRQSDQGIAILSAFFGSTGLHVAECPPKSSSNATSQASRADISRIQSDGAEGEDLKEKSRMTNDLCQSSFATERLMSRCVGRGMCSVPVDSSVFGPASSCKPATDLHAKATYACVTRLVLKGLFAAPTAEGSKEEARGTDQTRIPLGAGGEEGPESDSQERGNALGAGQRVTEDYTGFVDAPRYVPELEQSNGRHYEDDDASRRPSGNPFTQIRRLFRNEDQNREKAGSKSPATDDQAITGIISRNAVHERDTLTHQQLITRGVSFWVSLSSFMKGMSYWRTSRDQIIIYPSILGERERERAALCGRHDVMREVEEVKQCFQSCTQSPI